MEEYFNRDISWLSFNHRVLQEAADPRVPLYERIKFLAIYSSNLDEFFRVRVASLRQFRQLKKSTRKEMSIKPKRELREIRMIVAKQQQQFGKIFREEILPALRSYHIHLLSAEEFSPQQQAFARKFGEKHLAPTLDPRLIKESEGKPFLQNKALYFAVTFPFSHDIGLVEIPGGDLPRFHTLPGPDGEYHLAFLDDLLRWNLDKFFGRQVEDAYAIKISRDADLHIEDEYAGDLLEKIKLGLRKRNVGVPSRFLYDGRMPVPVRNRLVKMLDLEEEDIARGARYHNFNDFFSFPDPLRDPNLRDPELPPLPHQILGSCGSIFELLKNGDQLLHSPYQSYAYVARWIGEAAADKQVRAIKISLYRIAKESKIIEALCCALAKGKKVTAFLEAKARFDESSNLEYGTKLEEAGAEVFYSYPAVKVHAKVLLFEREESSGSRPYAFIGTGNFNEKTARVYADHALLTADARICEDVRKVFGLLERRETMPRFDHLLIAPFSLRQGFIELVDKEIELANKGKEAYMVLKMNSLEDPAMVQKLYEASRAGVRIDLIVRGICCLMPGLPGISENIKAISIVDRFLEHSRIYVFGNGGNERMFLSSADWMTRNLDRRVEIAAPIYDPEVFSELRQIMNFQWNDNCKARIINVEQSNPYLVGKVASHPERSQYSIYHMLEKRAAEPHTGNQALESSIKPGFTII